MRLLPQTHKFVGWLFGLMAFFSWGPAMGKFHRSPIQTKALDQVLEKPFKNIYDDFRMVLGSQHPVFKDWEKTFEAWNPTGVEPTLMEVIRDTAPTENFEVHLKNSPILCVVLVVYTLVVPGAETLPPGRGGPNRLRTAKEQTTHQPFAKNCNKTVKRVLPNHWLATEFMVDDIPAPSVY